MLENYHKHAAERSKLGIPPLPLTAEQTSQLCENNYQNSPIPPNSTLPSRSLDITTTLVYGGVAVATIIAMSYFSHILLKGIKELLNDDSDT